MSENEFEFACALKNSEALSWSTNERHYNDKLKHLLAGIRRTGRACVSASGTEEEFGKMDQLLADFLSPVNKNEEYGRLEREESA
jgi:hypothetical protein